MRRSVAVSSGPMCTKNDERQQAVHPLHGTAASASPNWASRALSAHAENAPAARSVTQGTLRRGARREPPRRARLDCQTSSIVTTATSAVTPKHAAMPKMT